MQDKTTDIQNIEPETLTGLDIETLVEYYTRANAQIEEIEAAVTAVREEMMARLDDEGVKGKIVGEYTVTKATRVSFKTTLEQATELGAIKSAPDQTKLKSLHDQGIEVPGTSVTNYILVRPVSKAGEAA